MTTSRLLWKLFYTLLVSIQNYDIFRINFRFDDTQIVFKQYEILIVSFLIPFIIEMHETLNTWHHLSPKIQV